MAGAVPVVPRFRFSDALGNPLSNGSVTVYLAGTTTLANTYQDKGLTIANTNPVTLDANGECLFFVDEANEYKFLLKDSTGATLPGWPVDNIQTSGAGILTDLAANTGASLVGWIRAATGAVAYTLGTWLGWQEPNVLEFMSTAKRVNYLAGLGTLDMTAEVQAAEDAATAAGRVLKWPGGCALITDTINRGTGSQWVGEHRNQGTTSGFINGTQINFSPTSAKSLFVPTAPAALFRVGYCTDGFYIKGNSASAVGNSIYAFDVDGINKGRFANLTITNFRIGIRCNATINNRFEFVSIVNTYASSVLYDGGTCTTDVWDQCYFGNSPVGVATTAGQGHVGIRFQNQIFESIETYGMNLTREVSGWMVTNAYAEDTPNANVATNAMFRVGVEGAALPGATQLIVQGGYFGGRNAGGVGSLFYIDTIDGVILGGFHATRYTNGIQTTANTLTNQVVSLGWTCGSMSTQVTDDTKVEGFWPLTTLAGSSRNLQTHRLLGDTYGSASTACTGAITTAVSWSLERNGDVVTLKMPATTGVAIASPSFTFGEAVPAKYRPSANLSVHCPISDNGANQATPGLVLLNSATGVITVYKSGARTANFTAAAAAGLPEDTTLIWKV